MTDQEQFQAERLSGIGGSDIASVFNLGYGCSRRLWYAKRGTPEDPGRRVNRAMELGIVLEPYFADRYTEETGRQVASLTVQRHPDHPYLLVHLDRQIDDRDLDRTGGVLEIKSLGSAAFRRYKREGLPDDYALQLQHGMLVTGATWGAFCVGNRDTGEICHWDVERDPQVCAMIEAEGPEWWQRHMLAGEEPDRLEASDPRCAACQYLRTCRADEYVMPRGTGDMPEAPELRELLARYAALDAQYSVRIGEGKDAKWGTELDAEYEAVKDLLREALDGREAVTCGGAKVYNRMQAGREMWDMKGLVKAYREMRQHLRDSFPEPETFSRAGKPFPVLRIYLGEK